MLFRTVYGPELEAIYSYVQNCTIADCAASIDQVSSAFFLHGQEHNPQPVDDAVSFLISAGLIQMTDGHLNTVDDDEYPFALRLLHNLRSLEKGNCLPKHPLDPLYGLILSEVFVRHDQVFIDNVHTEANSLHQVNELGGLSKEKIQTWKRVMESLGVGHRIFGGFMCVYSPRLLELLFETWGPRQGTLQSFLEYHLATFLPYSRVDGELSTAVAAPLCYLEKTGKLSLFAMQDAPTRSYMGGRRVRGVSLEV